MMNLRFAPDRPSADLRRALPARQPVKVLHVTNGEYYAGAERVQELLAKGLPRFGYQVSFACLMHGAFHSRLADSDHDAVLVPMRSRFDAIPVARRIADHAREAECRLLHTHTPRGALVGGLAAALAGLPLVHHVHSPTARNTARGWIDVLNAWVERAALVRAQALVPVSNSLAHDLRRYGYPQGRIHPIPNGVAMSDQQVTPRLGETFTLGVVALFRPRKGIEVLLRALAILTEAGQRVRLRAIGEFESPAYEQQVRGMCDELRVADCVEWRGFRRNVVDELQRVDALVLPSLFGEGMPMVVLEAMAVGLPVIATRVEGVPEVVHDGVEGVLVEPGDEGALAEAISAMAADPEGLHAMGSAGRHRQRRGFSDAAMAESLGRVYDQVLSRSKCAAAGRLAAREAR